MAGTENQTQVLLQTLEGIKNGKIKTVAPLLPFMFNLRGVPFSLKDHFLWEPLFKVQVPKRRTVVAGRQVGKCIERNTKIVTEFGALKKICDVKVGDRVACINSDLKPSTGTVTNTWDSGTKEVLKITTRSNRSMLVTPDHLIKTLHGYTRAGDLKVGSRIAVSTERVGFSESPANINQDRIKFIAYMIGDGSTSSDSVSFKTADPEVLKEFSEIFSKYTLREPSYGKNINHKTKVRTYQIPISTIGTLKSWVVEDGLFGHKSFDKKCPDWVFSLSRVDLILFLSRLWATDGSIKKTPTGVPAITYSSTSYALITQVASLLAKLGIFCSITTRMGQYSGKKTRLNYELRVSQYASWVSFLSTIAVPGKPPVDLPTSSRNNNRDTFPIEIQDTFRKLYSNTTVKKYQSLHNDSLRNTLQYPLYRSKLDRFITFFDDQSSTDEYKFLTTLRDAAVFWDSISEIIPAGSADTVDIEVADQHNFILENGLVVHNSESVAVQTLTYSWIKDYFNILYVAPLFEQARVFSVDKVAPFIKGSPIFKDRDQSLPMNVTHRVAKEGNNLYFSYAGADAERIRSKTAGALFYDECQNLDPSCTSLISETLSASLDFGATQHTGTPKTFDNLLETEWSKSSQGEWCIPCTSCRKLNVSSVDCDLIGMIQPHGLACAKCGALLNSRLGWYEHRYSNKRSLHEGYHAPQVVFPAHCEHQPKEDRSRPPAKWVDILLAQQELSTAKFYNEKLGTSFDNADELISKKALMDNSILPHRNNLEEAVAASRSSKYVYISMGVDWGGGGESGLSRTAIAVIGWTADCKPHVLYMERILNPMPLTAEVAYLLKLFSLFKVNIIADDYCGAGSAKEIILLQTGFPQSKLMPIAYAPYSGKKVMTFVPSSETEGSPHIRTPKSKSLSIMAALINTGHYSFPVFSSWDEKDYADNLLSLVQEKLDRMHGGASYVITHKAGRADDLAHAINYATLAYWYITKNNPDFSKILQEEEVNDYSH